MTGSCLEIAEIVSSFLSLESTREAIQRTVGDRAAAIPDLVATGLPSRERAIWEAEAAAMPPGVMRQFGEAVVAAADHRLTFEFVNPPPDDVTGFARDRAIEVSFRYTETAITATIAHTSRHPSWLPAAGPAVAAVV